LYSDFSLIVGKEDVARTKPDDECYRRAVMCLNVDPAEAVALEDSPAGLAAAGGAGVRAVAVGHRLPEGPWVGASAFLPDLRATEQVLACLGMD
jgi:beta-phosphoglucomutase-like phosphatase (HAD superfamily)